MDSGEVRYDKQGRTVYLTFSRPEVRNAMTWSMYEQLREACERLREDDHVRVAVLRGDGREAFISGTDIRQFSEVSTADDGIGYENLIEGVLETLESVPKPTIAILDGYVMGGGLMIAAVCDFRICTPDAKFGLPIARTVGNCLSMRNCARLVALLGVAEVKRLIMLADVISAEEALTSGLVTEIVERNRLKQRVEEFSAELEGNAPLTIWAAKEGLRRLVLSNLPNGDDIVRAVYGSEDFREGVSAFLEKRVARWQNR